MASPLRRDASRYRRRILVLGAAVFALLYVVMAPMYVDGVESDLEERVPADLAEVGYVGVTASFDGQDGTLSCESPLTDPESARAAAYEVWGVRSIELDRSCRVRTSDEAAPTTVSPSVTTVVDTEGDADADGVSGSNETATGSAEIESFAGPATEPSTVTTAPPTTTAGPAFDSVTEAIAGSPQLSLFSVLLQESGLAAELADPTGDAMTIFAPSDEAFEAVPADRLGDLRADTDALRRLVLHHAAPGMLHIDRLEPGELDMVDESTQPVGADPATIGGVGFAATDIDAPNGVTHIIEAVLLPDDLDPSGTTEPVSVQLDADGVTISGVVSSDAVRATLIESVDPSVDLTDTLTVDVDRGVDSATAGRLAQLLDVLQGNLVNGVAGFDGEMLYLGGTYLSEADRDAAVVVAAELGVDADLTAPPEATEDDADSLEAELNRYVADHPVRFEQNSATISDESLVVIDRIAELAQQFDSVAITVEGHTDSDGNPDDNLWLSRIRASAVSDALVERGLDGATVTWEGFGSEQPILVDGVEDKSASRRVEFRVEPLS